MPLKELVKDETRRLFYSQSFDLPQVHRDYGRPVPQPGSGGHQLFVGPGTIKGAKPWPGGYIGPFKTATGFVAVYSDAEGMIRWQPVTESSAAVFPENTFPLCVIALDTANRMGAIDDWRPR